MNDRDYRREKRFQSVLAYLVEVRPDFAGKPERLAQFDRFAANDEKLSAARTGQVRTLTTKASLLDALRLDHKDIARTARVIALTEPTFAEDYRLPDNTSEIAITTYTERLLELLEDQPDDAPAVKTAKAARREKFTALELPDDFVADLRADREALRAENQRKQNDHQTGVASTATLDELLTVVGTEVAVLDTIMRNKYRRDPGKLAAWSAASRVHRDPVRPREEKGDSTPPAGAGTPPQA